MARLDPPLAAHTAADLHLVAGDHARRRRGQVLLVLAGHPLDLELAAAVGAGRRQPDTDHPVHPLGDRPAGVEVVGRTGLAPRPPGTGRGGVLGERRRLALGRPAAPRPGRRACARESGAAGWRAAAGRPARGARRSRVPAAQAADTAGPHRPPKRALSVPHPARHKGQTLRHDRRPQPPVSADFHVLPVPQASVRSVQVGAGLAVQDQGPPH